MLFAKAAELRNLSQSSLEIGLFLKKEMTHIKFVHL